MWKQEINKTQSATRQNEEGRNWKSLLIQFTTSLIWGSLPSSRATKLNGKFIDLEGDTCKQTHCDPRVHVNLSSYKNISRADTKFFLYKKNWSNTLLEVKPRHAASHRPPKDWQAQKRNKEIYTNLIQPNIN